MPKGKAKGRRGGGTTGAERRAKARDLPAIKAIAESCDELRGLGRGHRLLTAALGDVQIALPLPGGLVN